MYAYTNITNTHSLHYSHLVRSPTIILDVLRDIKIIGALVGGITQNLDFVYIFLILTT